MCSLARTRFRGSIRSQPTSFTRRKWIAVTLASCQCQFSTFEGYRKTGGGVWPDGIGNGLGVRPSNRAPRSTELIFAFFARQGFRARGPRPKALDRVPRPGAVEGAQLADFRPQNIALFALSGRLSPSPARASSIRCASGRSSLIPRALSPVRATEIAVSLALA